MEIENVMFWISSIYIIPIWGLMWFAPRHEITKKIVGDLRIAVLPLCIPYAILAIPSLTGHLHNSRSRNANSRNNCRVLFR